MTEKLPRVTASEIIRVLEKAGFSFSRQSGSHKYIKTKRGKEQLFHIIQEKSFTPRP